MCLWFSLVQIATYVPKAAYDPETFPESRLWHVPHLGRFSLRIEGWTLGGSILYFFGISIGIKRRMAKKLLFTVCKIFKNIQFFSHLHLKYGKVLLWPKNFFPWKISIWVSKRRWISYCFQIRWCQLWKMPSIKVKSKKPRKMCKNENTQNSNSFLAIAFYGHLFKSASTNLKSA